MSLNGTTILHVAEDRNVGVILDSSLPLHLSNPTVLLAPPAKHMPHLITFHVCSTLLTEFSASFFPSCSSFPTQQLESSVKDINPSPINTLQGHTLTQNKRHIFFSMTHKVLPDTAPTVTSLLGSHFTHPCLLYFSHAIHAISWRYHTSCYHRAFAPTLFSPWNTCPWQLSHSLLFHFFSILCYWTASKKIFLPHILLFPSFPAKFYYLIFLDNIYFFHKLCIYLFPIFPTSV